MVSNSICETNSLAFRLRERDTWRQYNNIIKVSTGTDTVTLNSSCRLYNIIEGFKVNISVTTYITIPLLTQNSCCYL